jgi:hypothetical protein
MANGRWYTVAIERILKFFDHYLRCWEISIAISTFTWIVWDEVDMSESSLEELTQLTGVFETIGDTVYHDIFIKNTLVRDLYIGIDSLK